MQTPMSLWTMRMGRHSMTQVFHPVRSPHENMQSASPNGATLYSTGCEPCETEQIHISCKSCKDDIKKGSKGLCRPYRTRGCFIIHSHRVHTLCYAMSPRWGFRTHQGHKQPAVGTQLGSLLSTEKINNYVKRLVYQFFFSKRTLRWI